MEIKSISGRILKSSSNRIENSGAQTNPFGVSFKGNIITADVFDTTSKSKVSFGANLAQRAVSRSKMAVSAAIGSMNSMGKSLREFARVDSIINLGRKVRENVAGALNYLNTNNLKMELEMRFAIVKRETKGLFRTNLFSGGTEETQNLKELDVDQLKPIFREIAGLKEAMAV